MSETIGGKYTVRGAHRQGELGTWHQLSHVDGHIRGALVLETSAFPDQAAVGRLGAMMRAVAQLRLPGLLNLIDQVLDGGRVWLVTVVPATPTLAQALAAKVTLPPEAAVHIAAETGQTLVKLHAAGMAHGDVRTGTVVLAASGVAMLAECGYAHALAGTTPAAAQDTAAWAQLAHELAAVRADDKVKQVLTHAAAQAETAGLPAALSTLATAARGIPGYGERGALAALAAAVPAPAEQAQAQVDPHQEATRMGRRSGAPAAPARVPGEVMRFGSGVAPPPSWTGAASASPPPRPRGRRKRRITSVLSGLLTVAILAAVGWYLLRDKLNPLVVEAATVAVSADAGAVDGVISACDVQVDVVGTVTTNGGSGAVEYEWIRNDGKTTGILVERLARGTTNAQLHLFWEFKGRGTFNAVATLKVHSPAQLEAKTEFTYRCTG